MELEKIELKIEANASDASSKIDDLVSSLKNLSTATSSSNIKGLSSIASSLKKIGSVNSSGLVSISSSIRQLTGGLTALASNSNLSAVNSTVNAINRLSQANLGNFDANKMNVISNSISGLASQLSMAGTIDTHTSQVVSALARLSATGASIGTVTQELPTLGKQIVSLASDLSRADSIDANVTKVVESIAKLSSAGSKIEVVVKNLDNLGNGIVSLMSKLQGVGSINTNIANLVQGLGNIASSGASSGRAGNSLITSLNGFTKSSKKASKSAFSLAAAFGKLYASYWLIFRAFGKLKDAMDISSDLTEVENVVRQTFGQYESLIQDFSKTSIQNYGMSELTAKQVASRFQAMGVAIGYSQGEMADMSLTLTKLTGDLASFYNEEQEDVARRLQAIFTGETEPLRRYGLDLTQATLKEWAMKKGLDANISSMSQAEKTMLRYQYVLENTSVATNDFQRTSDTWANQVRQLKQNFEQLASVIGGALINAFKPFVKTLNAVLQKVISFVTTVTNALGSIFGWKYEVSATGITDDWSDSITDAADGMSDLAGSEDDAAESAKKLKNTIMGFDEINALTDNSDDSDSGSGSGSGSGTSGVGSGDVGNLVPTDTIFKKFESDIDSLYKLGETISKALRNALADIDWDSIYEKARNFGTGLAEFLNGLIRPDTFYQVGRTLANSLNTVVYGALSFAETFDWSNLGKSIAAGINGVFANWDAKSTAQLINKWVQGIFTMVITAIGNVKWSEVGKRIGEFLGSIEIKTVAIILGALTIKKIAKMQLAKTVLSQISKSITSDLTTAIATKLGATEAKTVGEAIWTWIKRGVSKSGSSQTAAIGSTIASQLSSGMKFTIGGAGLVTEFTLVSRAMAEVMNQGKLTAGSVLEIGTAAGVAVGALKLIGLSNPFTAVLVGVTSLMGGLYGLEKAMKQTDFDGWYDSMKNIGSISVDEITAPTIQAFNTISESYSGLKTNISSISETKESISETVSNIELIGKAIDMGAYSAEEKIPEIIALMQGLLEDTKTVFDEEYNTITRGLAGAMGDTLEKCGVDVEEFMNVLYLAKNNGDEVLASAEQQLNELTKQFENGEITAGEYLAQAEPLLETLGSIDLNSATSSISGYTDALNVAKYTTENGFDAETLNADLSQMTDAYHSTVDSVKSDLESYKQSVQNYISTAERLGYEIPEKYKNIDWTMVDETTLADVESQMQELIQATTNELQVGLLNQIPEIMNQASEQWEEMNPLKKAIMYGNNIDNYYQEQLQQWKTNTVEPFTNEISTALQDVGIEGSTFATEASRQIIDAMFDNGEIIDQVTGKATVIKGSLKSNWNEICNQSMDELGNIAQGYGKDTVDGYVNGVESSKSQAEGIMNKFSDWIKNAFHNSSLKFGSPSKAMQQYGQWSVEGYNNGISDKKGTTDSLISQYTSGIVNAFSNINGSLHSAGSYAMQGLLSGISSMASSIYDRARSIANNVADTIRSALDIHSPSRVMAEIGGYTMQGFQNGIESYYGSIQDSLVGFSEGISEAPMPDFRNASSAYSSYSKQGTSTDGITSYQASNQSSGSTSSNIQIVLQLDGKEIGRTSVDYINGQIRRGASPLMASY